MTAEAIGSVAVRAEVLLQGIERVKHAMAKDESRPILTCICIEDREDGDLSLVAADNYRIAIARVEVIEGERTGEVGPFLIPRHSLSTVVAFLKAWRKVLVKIDRLEPVLAGPVARISCTHGTVGIVGVSGTYPNYRKVVMESSASLEDTPAFSLNPNFLRDLPKHLSIGDVRVKGSLDPVRITSLEGDYEEILMPVRRPYHGVFRPVVRDYSGVRG